MKLGWNMCNVCDYIRIIRCYKSIKFNHRAQDCKGALTCPICAENHPCGNVKPQKRSTNATTAPTSINITTNHQLMPSTPPWTIAAAAIKIYCGNSPKPLTINNACKEKGYCRPLPNQFTTFKNSN